MEITGEPRIYALGDYERHIMSLIEYECESKYYDGHMNLLVNDKAKLLLDLLLMRLNEEKTFNMPSQNRNAVIFETAVKYMKKNLQKNITINELSGVCYVSPSKIKEVFKNYTGKGVISYFQIIKLAVAKELLLSNMSIKEVSDKLGFSSQAYFSMWFKKSTGITPLKYSASKKR